MNVVQTAFALEMSLLVLWVYFVGSAMQGICLTLPIVLSLGEFCIFFLHSQPCHWIVGSGGMW